MGIYWGVGMKVYGQRSINISFRLLINGGEGVNRRGRWGFGPHLIVGSKGGFCKPLSFVQGSLGRVLPVGQGAGIAQEAHVCHPVIPAAGNVNCGTVLQVGAPHVAVQADRAIAFRRGA